MLKKTSFETRGYVQTLQKNFPQFSRWKKSPLTTFPCFYCNVDSDELKYFLLLFIGGLSLGAVCLGVGLGLRGAFKSTEKLADLPFKLQQDESKANISKHEDNINEQ